MPGAAAATKTASYGALARQPWDALHADHVVHQIRQQGCLVSGAGPDLKHPLPSAQAERLEVAGLGRWLRNGLPVANWEGGVLVRLALQGSGDKQMPRGLAERPKHREIAHALGAQFFDQARAVAAVAIAYSPSRHAPTASSSP
jgi:hypothetical protein